MVIIEIYEGCRESYVIIFAKTGYRSVSLEIGATDSASQNDEPINTLRELLVTGSLLKG